MSNLAALSAHLPGPEPRQTGNAQAGVFIDGKYLEQVLQYDFQDSRIDIGKLAWVMSRPGDLLRAYYYSCWPWQHHPPTTEDELRLSRKHKLITAISHLPRFEVRMGHLAKIAQTRTGLPVFKRKMIDCWAGVDIALLAVSGKISSISVLSGERDIVPGVQAAKSAGVAVILWHGNTERTRPSLELYEMADERRTLDQELLRQIQFHPPRNGAPANRLGVAR